MARRVKDLRAVLERRPEYPRRAWAFYYLGQNLQGLDRNLEAYSAFRSAARLKPGLGYCVPIERCLDETSRAALRHSGEEAVRWILAILLLAGAAGFYFSRPWRWLKPPHLALPVLGLGAWWLFLLIGSRAASGLADRTGGGFSKPVFMSTTLNAPGGALLWNLFWYGAAGLVGCFVLAVAATSLPRRWLRVAVAGLGGILLWSALMAGFFFEHVDARCTLETDDGFCAVAYFDQEAIEPFVLTDPRSFPGMDARTIHHDPVLRNWILEHVPGAVGAPAEAGE
jgi:hypothetical protein